MVVWKLGVLAWTLITDLDRQVDSDCHPQAERRSHINSFVTVQQIIHATDACHYNATVPFRLIRLESLTIISSFSTLLEELEHLKSIPCSRVDLLLCPAHETCSNLLLQRSFTQLMRHL